MKGKALLVITKRDSRGLPFDVRCYIQSCSGNFEHRDCAQEDFQLLEADALPAPDAAYKLREGESVTVSVVFEFDYHRDAYTGEWDVELWYHKQRVLKRTRAPRHYVAKADR